MAHRHKRDTDARRNSRRKPRAALVAAPLALLATTSAVGLGVLAQGPQPVDVPTEDAAAAALPPQPILERREPISRSQDRLEAQRERRAAARELAVTQAAVAHAHEKRWTTTLLNLWSDSSADATQVGLLEGGKHVLVTGRAADGRQEIVWEGRSRWVTAGYLAEHKPRPEPDPAQSAERSAPAGLSTAPCPDSGVENGLTSEAVAVYRAVCHAFPQISTYGGWDDHGEHASGRALDIMTSDKGLGDQIAAFLQSHSSELDLYDIIWWDQIWTPERASEGWRPYGDHGSATANHMDHVHVSTNG